MQPDIATTDTSIHAILIMAQQYSTSRHQLINGPFHLSFAAINMHREEPRLAARSLSLSFPYQWQDNFSVGLGDIQFHHLFSGVPIQPTFAHVVRLNPHSPQNLVDEHEPVAFTFERGFGDHPQQVESFERKVQSDFFMDLALSTLGGGFAGVHIELAADWGEKPQVGGLLAMEQKVAALVIDKVADAGKFVGQI